MTPSEVLLTLEYGYRSLKLFPADGTASVKMLKSLKGPFTGIRFCPTGGVNLDNLLNFLRLPNRRLCRRHLVGAAEPDPGAGLGSDHTTGQEARELAGSLEQH